MKLVPELTFFTAWVSVRISERNCVAMELEAGSSPARLSLRPVAIFSKDLPRPDLLLLLELVRARREGDNAEFFGIAHEV